jgi:hypothetical protein
MGTESRKLWKMVADKMEAIRNEFTQCQQKFDYFPATRGASRKQSRPPRLIREDDPDLASNYVNFAFLVSP